MNMNPRMELAAVAAALALTVWSRTPEEVFRNPPPEAHAGVWWHWMGGQVTREGIVKDLDWFVRVGVTSATVFGMADSCTPWAKRILGIPTDGLRPYSERWWELLKFACAEGRRRGIDIGLHNCPGYTSTGGPWIPPRLAMRRLIFCVKDPAKDIPLQPDASSPVYDEVTGVFGRPDCLARRTDYVRLGNVNGIEIGHVTTGAYVQPADWDSFGLECDKMNPEAVAFHLDHVLGEMRRHLGDDLPAAGLRHVLLDSYEAGNANWTPAMREEFKARRGYDCFRFLPVLGGYTNGYTVAECVKFRADFARTVKDLYRDVLFKIMAEKLHAAGLAFANEPYDGPFEPQEVAPYIDRIMTEFWFRPGSPAQLYRSSHSQFGSFAGPGGRRHNIVEAEAFTGQPGDCPWTETPAALKLCGDHAWLMGVNRFILHTCPLQPWGDEVKPGVTMGRWGTHFGRNQTWAESGKAWFDYVARCQALLQWGAPAADRLDVPFAQLTRAAGNCRIHFLVNESDAVQPLDLPCDGRWFDPVFGTIGPPPHELHPRQSGFWVTGEDAPACVAVRAAVVQSVTLSDWKPALGDWTRDADPAIRHFSGTRTYRTKFDHTGTGTAEIDLGQVWCATATVRINGMTCGTVWCAPWRVPVPAGMLRETGNTIEIDVVNTWHNRLVGDEHEPPDVMFAPAPMTGGNMMLAYPDWFAAGIATRPSKGRRCFTTWNYFTAATELVPAGLAGPVKLTLFGAP